MAMAKYTDIAGKALVNNLLDLLDLTKEEFCTAFNCTEEQVKVLIKESKGPLTKTTLLARKIIAAYNVCRIQSGDGAGPLRAAVEEALGEIGNVRFAR